MESFVTEELSNSVITKFFSSSVGQSTRQRTVCKNCPGEKDFRLSAQQDFWAFNKVSKYLEDVLRMWSRFRTDLQISHNDLGYTVRKFN